MLTCKDGSSYIFGVTFLIAFIFSPIWGRIGDKHGYKGILILTSVGLSICIFLMGFAHSVTYLLILRIFMGVVTGFIGVSNAFIARQTPRNEVEKSSVHCNSAVLLVCYLVH